MVSGYLYCLGPSNLQPKHKGLVLLAAGRQHQAGAAHQALDTPEVATCQDHDYFRFRRGVIESAVKCYKDQVAASRRGEKPFYRPSTWEAAMRRKRKQIAKMAWFRTADMWLRVPYTPGSDLAKRVRVVVEEEAMRLQLQEKVV